MAVLSDSDYELFGVSRGVSSRELRQAYLDLVNVWHPDRFTGKPRLQAKAQRQLQDINDAYKRLQNGGAKSVLPTKCISVSRFSSPKRAWTNIGYARLVSRTGDLGQLHEELKRVTFKTSEHHLEFFVPWTTPIGKLAHGQLTGTTAGPEIIRLRIGESFETPEWHVDAIAASPSWGPPGVLSTWRKGAGFSRGADLG